MHVKTQFVLTSFLENTKFLLFQFSVQVALFSLHHYKDHSGFTHQINHLLAMCPWTNYTTPLSLTFYKTNIVIVPPI